MVRGDDYHRQRGRTIRPPVHIWEAAQLRAEADSHGSLNSVITGWLAAYAAGRLDPMPETTETADEP